MKKSKSEHLIYCVSNVMQMKSEHLIHMKVKFERLICRRQNLNG